MIRKAVAIHNFFDIQAFGIPSKKSCKMMAPRVTICCSARYILPAQGRLVKDV